MADILNTFIDSIVFILPAFFANASPTILGKGTAFNGPIDCGRYWKGNEDLGRILGDGKTIRGFIGGTLTGTLISPLVILLLVFFGETATYLSYSNQGVFYTLFKADDPYLISIIIGFLQSTGALLGDLIGSFIKRRTGLKRGETFLFMDQLGFLFVALVLTFFVIPFPLEWVMILIPITFVVHIVMNLLGYIIGLQKVPL